MILLELLNMNVNVSKIIKMLLMEFYILVLEWISCVKPYVTCVIHVRPLPRSLLTCLFLHRASAPVHPPGKWIVSRCPTNSVLQPQRTNPFVLGEFTKNPQFEDFLKQLIWFTRLMTPVLDHHNIDFNIQAFALLKVIVLRNPKMQQKTVKCQALKVVNRILEINHGDNSKSSLPTFYPLLGVFGVPRALPPRPRGLPRNCGIPVIHHSS